MMKRLFACLMCVLLLCSCFTVTSFADSNVKSLNLYTYLYDENGNISEQMEFAYVHIPSGFHKDVDSLTYEDLHENGALISYTEVLLQIDILERLSSQYAYIIALINSSCTNTVAQISTSLEVATLNSFLKEKWDDPSNNYAYRSYIQAAYLLGACCLYSSDIENIDPSTSFEFNEWFHAMNKTFIEDWSLKYRETFDDASCAFANVFTPDTMYHFECGERAKLWSAISKTTYHSDSLNFGGLYFSDQRNGLTLIMTVFNMIDITTWFVWMPAGFFSYTSLYFIMIFDLLLWFGVKKATWG